MEQNRKYLLLTGAGAFVAGVAVTLTVFALTFCPARDYAKWHKHWRAQHPVAAMVQPMPGPFHHDGVRGSGKHGPDGRFEHRGARGGDMRRPDDLRRPGHPDFHPQKDMKDRFAKRLGLTDEQKKQIEEFRREDMKKMEPLFKQMDELRQQADALRAENKARFESVLTAEQKEILQKMHQKRMERLKKRRQGKPFGRPAMQPAEDVPGDLPVSAPEEGATAATAAAQ